MVARGANVGSFEWYGLAFATLDTVDVMPLLCQIEYQQVVHTKQLWVGL